MLLLELAAPETDTPARGVPAVLGRCWRGTVLAAAHQRLVYPGPLCDSPSSSVWRIRRRVCGQPSRARGSRSSTSYIIRARCPNSCAMHAQVTLHNAELDVQDQRGGVRAAFACKVARCVDLLGQPSWGHNVKASKYAAMLALAGVEASQQHWQVRLWRPCKHVWACWGSCVGPQRGGQLVRRHAGAGWRGTFRPALAGAPLAPDVCACGPAGAATLGPQRQGHSMEASQSTAVLVLAGVEALPEALAEAGLVHVCAMVPTSP